MANISQTAANVAIGSRETRTYPTIIGPATTAALLAFDVIESGVAKP